MCAIASGVVHVPACGRVEVDAVVLVEVVVVVVVLVVLVVLVVMDSGAASDSIVGARVLLLGTVMKGRVPLLGKVLTCDDVC